MFIFYDFKDLFLSQENGKEHIFLFELFLYYKKLKKKHVSFASPGTRRT